MAKAESVGNKKQEQRNPWDAVGGIYYGNNEDGKPKLFTGNGNILTTGPTGSGKTKRLVVPALARLAGKASVVITDLNDELTQMLAPHFEAMGSDVVIYAPFGGNSRGLNTLQCMAVDDDMPDNAMAQAEAKIKANSNNHQPHFPRGAQDLDAGLQMFVRLVIPNGSHADVRALMAKGTQDLQEMIVGDQFEYEGTLYPGILRAATTLGWPEMAAKVARYSDIKPDNTELLGIISTGLVETRWEDSRRIKKEMKGPTYDFKVMKKKTVAVFLCLPPKRVATHAPWIRMNTTQIVQDLMAEIAKPTDLPWLVVLDEFFALADGDSGGSFDIVTKNQSQVRKYGGKIWTIWQDLSQASKLIGKDGFETFIANSGLFNNFAPQDVFSAKFLSDRAGVTTEPQFSINKNESRTFGQFRRSKSFTGSYNQVSVPVLLPQEIRNMKDGETLVFSREIDGGQGIYNCPYPDAIKGLEEIMARDPSA